MLTPAQISLDLSFPIQMRMQALLELSEEEVDNVLECICSMYNIHPTHYALEYLRHLILHDKPCLKRRIRIAETCDLGRSVLYLLAKMENIQERIGCIEMISNVYLKLHAYSGLYPKIKGDLSTEIQIMKNMFGIFSKWKVDYFSWFVQILEDVSVMYVHRSNCADFILSKCKDEKLRAKARILLNIANPEVDFNIYKHRENVHLFVPRPQFIEQLFESKCEITPVEKILGFAAENHIHRKILQSRILNDMTKLGTLKHSFTLTELLCRMWADLTEDLRLMLLQDIESSNHTEDGWMCTTGYYTRMINVYQASMDNQSNSALIPIDIQHFQDIFFERMNFYLAQFTNEDAVLQILETSEAKRIAYLTFKVKHVPLLINELSQTFAQLSQETFDDFFSRSTRSYEQAM